MITIYCIEDINDLKYIGSTKINIEYRLSQHRCDLRRSTCSSCKLNLYNSIIYELEKCDENERKQRERYWIDQVDCVNKKKLNGRNKNLKFKRNKIKMRENNKRYYHRNKPNTLISNFVQMISHY